MNLGLDGKVAIVTSPSKGLGRAIAQELGQEGARLAICARGKQELEQATRELREPGVEVLALEADVARVEGCRKVIARTVDEFGRLDILVNNAGDAWLTHTPQYHRRGVALLHGDQPAQRRAVHRRSVTT